MKLPFLAVFFVVTVSLASPALAKSSCSSNCREIQFKPQVRVTVNGHPVAPEKWTGLWVRISHKPISLGMVGNFKFAALKMLKANSPQITTFKAGSQHGWLNDSFCHCLKSNHFWIAVRGEFHGTVKKVWAKNNAIEGPITFDFKLDKRHSQFESKDIIGMRPAPTVKFRFPVEKPSFVTGPGAMRNGPEGPYHVDHELWFATDHRYGRCAVPPPNPLPPNYKPTYRHCRSNGDTISSIDKSGCRDRRSTTGWPNCYGGHEGTDYMLTGGLLSMHKSNYVVAAAIGEIVAYRDGSFDKCNVFNYDNGTTSCGQAKYNNFVRIRHANGIVSEYHHLKKWSVVNALKKLGLKNPVGNKEEQQLSSPIKVTCGTRIGRIGSSGMSFAPHLHFSVKHLVGNDIGNSWQEGRMVHITDPYAGHLSHHSYWVNQRNTNQLPTTTCQYEERRVWVGTAPFCKGRKSDCTSRQMTFVKFDKKGNGKTCTTGTKVLCERKDSRRQQYVPLALYWNSSKKSNLTDVDHYPESTVHPTYYGYKRIRRQGWVAKYKPWGAAGQKMPEFTLYYSKERDDFYSTVSTAPPSNKYKVVRRLGYAYIEDKPERIRLKKWYNPKLKKSFTSTSLQGTKDAYASGFQSRASQVFILQN